MSVDDFPEKYKTNKNFRYWYANNAPKDFYVAPDDCYYHEVPIVEFAKQYHAEEIKDLQQRLEEAEEVIRFYAEEGDFFDQYDDDFSMARHKGSIMEIEVVGKRARQYLEKYK